MLSPVQSLTGAVLTSAFLCRHVGRRGATVASSSSILAIVQERNGDYLTEPGHLVCCWMESRWSRRFNAKPRRKACVLSSHCRSHTNHQTLSELGILRTKSADVSFRKTSATPADTALNNSERPCDLQPFDACSHHSLADNSARLRNNDSVSAISGSGRCGRFKRLTRDAAMSYILGQYVFHLWSG